MLVDKLTTTLGDGLGRLRMGPAPVEIAGKVSHEVVQLAVVDLEWDVAAAISALALPTHALIPRRQPVGIPLRHDLRASAKVAAASRTVDLKTSARELSNRRKRPDQPLPS